MRRVDGWKVARLTLGGLSACLWATGIERRRDGVAEVSRGHSSRWYQPVKGRTCREQRKGGHLDRAGAAASREGRWCMQ